MSKLALRLLASVQIDAINGDAFERCICAKQMSEAVTELIQLEADRKALGEMLMRAIRAEEAKSVYFRASWLSSAREVVARLNIPCPEGKNK